MKPTPEEMQILRAEPERCETCGFWLGEEPDAARQLLQPADGVCQRYPPNPKGWFRRRSPNHYTSAFQWCGEWRDRETRRPSRIFQPIK